MLGCLIVRASSVCNKQHSKKFLPSLVAFVHAFLLFQLLGHYGGFSIFCLHIVACIFSFKIINVVFMPPFDLEVACKCNTPVEPITQTAAKHTVGGVQKRSDDELDVVPNKLSVTFPSRGVPCPLPPSWLVMLSSGASHPLPLSVAG